MALQSLIVFAVVAGCFGYTAWSLLPQAACRALAKGLLRLPLPPSLVSILENTASAAAGCQCSGCDQAQPKASPSATQALVFYPRKRR
ncbi:MAG: hypothetical protein PHS32_13650 [Rhodoferax sp.]|uniref:hypothetical protein n=1 Tax=Rhodoferax sp. TaxID=50421 RepID=UPI0026261203|nr:hypothetical protein [Rhodoferax sp.]MDD5334774.1 hypothetical protein [Rhodoferax sp.]